MKKQITLKQLVESVQIALCNEKTIPPNAVTRPTDFDGILQYLRVVEPDGSGVPPRALVEAFPDLWDFAIQNTRKKMVCEKLDDVVNRAFKLSGERNDNFPMLILTTADHCFGAGALVVAENVFKSLSGVDEVGIIPSSVHEVIIFPADVGDLSEIDETISEVNRSFVSEDDWLGDKVLLKKLR